MREYFKLLNLETLLIFETLKGIFSIILDDKHKTQTAVDCLLLLFSLLTKPYQIRDTKTVF